MLLFVVVDYVVEFVDGSDEGELCVFKNFSVFDEFEWNDFDGNCEIGYIFLVVVWMWFFFVC